MQSLTASELGSYGNSVNKVAPVSDGTQWIDYAASSFEGGEGTAESPYLIKTAEQLAKIAKDVRDIDTTYEDTYFKMVADIDLDGHEWTPIGYNYSEGDEIYKKDFMGKFDGDGHKIMNLYINGLSRDKSVGLFNNTEEGFELRNLTIESGKIFGDMIVGGLVGYNNGLIENCVNKATVQCVIYYAAGISGSNYRQGIIRQCINYGEILAGKSGNGMTGAGITSSCYGNVEECANFGRVYSITSGTGGIVGIHEGGVIRNCFNKGELVSDANTVGGIVAQELGRGGNCEIYNCYNAGKITGIEELGGVFGFAMFSSFNTLTVKDCYYSSDLFSGDSFGYYADFFGLFNLTEAPTMTSEDMMAESFVTTLNNGSGSEETVWMADTKNINGGFPILSFMKDISTGITTQKLANNVKVYASGNMIVVEGAEGEPMQVYTTGGQMVYNGKAADTAIKAGMYVVRINNNSYKVLVK